MRTSRPIRCVYAYSLGFHPSTQASDVIVAESVAAPAETASFADGDAAFGAADADARKAGKASGGAASCSPAVMAAAALVGALAAGVAMLGGGGE